MRVLGVARAARVCRRLVACSRTRRPAAAPSAPPAAQPRGRRSRRSSSRPPSTGSAPRLSRSRMAAARTVRRAPRRASRCRRCSQAVAEHADGYVRFRALVLLSGFNDPRTRDVMVAALARPERSPARGRLRATSSTTRIRSVVPRLLEALDKRGVRVRASRADARARRARRATRACADAMDGLVMQGQDFFRSAVIEALGDYKARVRAAERSPRSPSSRVRCRTMRCWRSGRSATRRRSPMLAGLAAHRAARRRSRRSRPPSACSASTARRTQRTSPRRCASRSPTPGFQELLRASASGLAALAVAGQRGGARDARSSRACRPATRRARRSRSRIGTVALRNTPLVLKVLEDAPDPRRRRSLLLRDAFDMLEEDFEEERFFVDRPPRATGRPPTDLAARTRRRRRSSRRSSSDAMDYKQSGVDIDAGNEVVRRIRSLARGTFTPGVLSEIGSFGGLFRLGARGRRRSRARRQRRRRRHQAARRVHDRRPRHRSARDLVNHCVNDILVQGARAALLPRLPRDRPARSRRRACRSSRGSRARCRENGCALLGGETAEMPGFYADGEYDLAGFIVGVGRRERADRRHAASRRATCSSGCPRPGCTPTATRWPAASRSTSRGLRRRRHVPELGDDGRRGAARAAPLVPARDPAAARRRGVIKGMAHITGGGITDNLPRILPAGTAARRSIAARGTCRALFQWLQRTGGVPDADMLRTFNMGIGLIVACAPDRRDARARARWRRPASPRRARDRRDRRRRAATSTYR